MGEIGVVMTAESRGPVVLMHAAAHDAPELTACSRQLHVNLPADAHPCFARVICQACARRATT